MVNTPHGSASGGSPRIDGYEIRTAAVMANIPCITTVQGLGRRRPGHRGAASPATSASARSRTGRTTCAPEPERGRLTAYDVLFDRVLTRTDPERAHHAAFRAIRAARAR